MAYAIQQGSRDAVPLLCGGWVVQGASPYIMHSIFHSTLDDFLLVYLDELLVFSSTVAKHE